MYICIFYIMQRELCEKNLLIPKKNCISLPKDNFKKDS